MLPGVHLSFLEPIHYCLCPDLVRHMFVLVRLFWEDIVAQISEIGP